jgi:long-chain acyl-CoA synthetase
MNAAVKTICDVVLQMPLRDKNKTAIKNKVNGQWQDISWQEYYKNIETAACALLSYGIKPGDRIAIMSNTRYEWSVCDFAIMGIQAVTVPIYQTVTPEDLEHILNNSQSRVLFIENRSMLKNYLKVKDKCPSVEKLICFETLRDSDLHFSNWNEFLAIGNQEKFEQKSQFESLCGSLTRQDSATVIYTSGTTGLPKGVLLTHEQIMSEVSEAFPHLGANSKDISLSFLPYAHVLGRIEHWGHTYIGYTMAYAEGIEQIKHNLKEIRPTIMIAVPRIFEKVYSGIHAQMGNHFLKTKAFRWALEVGRELGDIKINKKSIPIRLFAEYQIAEKLILSQVKAAFGGRLRFAVCGGAPLSQDIALFFHACGILILEGYGLSETTAAITCNTPYNYRFGSVGRPIGDVQIKIAEDGEVLIKSKKVMKEYYLNKEETDKVFSGGWFHTGDIGEILSSGDLKITDRKKDLIKTAGGKYVAPQKLENLISTHQGISHILIHGDQQKYIVALITLDPAFTKRFFEEKNIPFVSMQAASEHPAISDYVRKAIAETNTHLASFETIKRFTILPAEFTVESGELTPSLKIKRKFLTEKYSRQISALYR